MAGMNGSCARDEELLSAYLDGELHDGELAIVVGHLDGCEACIATFHALKETRTAVRMLPVLDAPAGLLPPFHLGDRLSAYLDGELRSPELSAVAGHLDVCTDCRNELYELDAARIAIRALPRLEPFGVAEALDEEHAHPNRRRAVVAVAAAGAVAAAALAFALVRPDPVAPLDLDTLATRHSARVSVETGFSVIPASIPDSAGRR
jgi:anti-sigma factor RsiW